VFFFWFIGIWVGIYLIGRLFETISEWRKKIKASIRNRAAHDSLTGRDIRAELDSFKRKLTLISPTVQSAHFYDAEHNYWQGEPQYLLHISDEKCPKCGQQSLKRRENRYHYGDRKRFISCSKCSYRISAKEAQAMVRTTLKLSNDQRKGEFLKEFSEAYF
jgi:DNA-directed RNA polymerase subunit M/transcription elongation factor TFIIS